MRDLAILALERGDYETAQQYVDLALRHQPHDAQLIDLREFHVLLC
jgi:Tfp pilus assembly protein PilF